MFDLGFWELLFIAIIALVVLGPERLPVAARAVGRWAGRARAYTRSLTDELNREAHVRELRARMAEAERELKSSMNRVEGQARELERDLAAPLEGEDDKTPPAGSDSGTEVKAADDATPRNEAGERQ